MSLPLRFDLKTIRLALNFERLCATLGGLDAIIIQACYLLEHFYTASAC